MQAETCCVQGVWPEPLHQLPVPLDGRPPDTETVMRRAGEATGSESP